MTTPHEHEWDFTSVTDGELRDCRVYEYLREAERARYEGREGAGKPFFTGGLKTYKHPPPWQCLSRAVKHRLTHHTAAMEGNHSAPVVRLLQVQELRGLLPRRSDGLLARVEQDLSPCPPKVQAGRMLLALDVDLAQSPKQIAAEFQKLLEVEIKKAGVAVNDGRGKKANDARAQLAALGFMRLRHTLPREELLLFFKKRFKKNLDERQKEKMASLAKRTFEDICGVGSEFMECAVPYLQRTNLPPAK